jgi:hypothetical protein
MKRLSFDEVRRNRKENRSYMWRAKSSLPHQVPADSRFGSDFFAIEHHSKFRLSRHAPVFAIGSCFARNIEKKLTDFGVEVTSAMLKLPPERYHGPRNSNALLNKYNTHSIESELRQTFETPSRNHGLIELDGLWYDPLTTAVKPADFETTMKTRLEIEALYRRIPECGAVIITLGLNESWLDTDTGIYFNGPPPAAILKRFKNRLCAEVSGLTDNVAALCKSFDILRKINPDVKVLVTVSPVPFRATVTKQDVVTANTHSKSMLRVCAQEVSDRFDFVDYFPSYEIVMNSPRDKTWLEDQMHVSKEAVGFVTKSFVDCYYEKLDGR